MSQKTPSDLTLLSLSTAEQGCSLAVMQGSLLLYEEFWSSKQTHSKRLLKMIEEMLENRTGLKLEDMDGFVAAEGPGSFTGLRIGMSVIKGLAYALGKPAVGVSSLDGIGFRFACSSLPVCAMMDAKRNEVYCSVYYFDKAHLISKTPAIVSSPKEVLRQLEGRQTLFAGSGSKAYRELIEQEAAGPVFTLPFSDSISASALVQSFYLTGNGFNVSHGGIAPRYVRKSDAERMIKNGRS